MSGLHFYKLDLHVHTPASRCYLDKKQTPEQIIQAALDMGLQGIAVTDHNNAAWMMVFGTGCQTLRRVRRLYP